MRVEKDILQNPFVVMFYYRQKNKGQAYNSFRIYIMLHQWNNVMSLIGYRHYVWNLVDKNHKIM